MIKILNLMEAPHPEASSTKILKVKSSSIKASKKIILTTMENQSQEILQIEML